MSTRDRRIERAQELAAQYPAVADLLGLYAAVIEAGFDSPRLADIVRRAAPKATAEETAALCARLAEIRATACTEGHRALLAILRPEGEGAKRSLLCGVCFTEWEFRRIVCPNCGEEDKDKLPVFTAEEFPHVRVEACDTCGAYLKAIDLTRNGLAVPEADELAAAPLDLWAIERGYHKVWPNLFGL